MIHTLALSLLVILVGCTHFRIDMTEYSDEKGLESCNITVFDNRPDLRIIGRDISFDVTPPMDQVASFKLCKNTLVKEYLNKNRNISIHINDIRIENIHGLFSYEVIGNLYGEMYIGNLPISLHAYASTFQKASELTPSTYQRVLDLMTNDLTSDIESILRTRGLANKESEF
jgi:hypothetical protein